MQGGYSKQKPNKYQKMNEKGTSIMVLQIKLWVFQVFNARKKFLKPGKEDKINGEFVTNERTMMKMNW